MYARRVSSCGLGGPGHCIWWEDGSGADPLDAPPVTVDQLVDLARDPRVHSDLVQ